MCFDSFVKLDCITSLVSVDVGSEVRVLGVDSSVHVEDTSGVGEGNGLSIEGRSKSRVLESSNSILKIHDGIVIDNPASPSFEILNEVDTSGSHDEGTVVGDGLRRSGR